MATELVKMARKLFGRNYPAFFNSDLGKRFEVPLLMILLNVILEHTNLKKYEFLQGICEDALVTEFSLASSNIINIFIPLLDELVNKIGAEK